jgi:hypothetical protein
MGRRVKENADAATRRGGRLRVRVRPRPALEFRLGNLADAKDSGHASSERRRLETCSSGKLATHQEMSSYEQMP